MRSAVGVVWFALGALPVVAQDRIAHASSLFAMLEGSKVHYKIIGSGQPTLVLVHGFSCNLGFWKGQIPLADSMRLVLVDLPGHGRSDQPEVAYTMERMARGIDAVLRAAKIDKAVLAGHSMGTPVVWQFSRLFPEKTQALIAVDGSFRSFVSGEEARRRLSDRYRGPDYAKSMAAVIDSLVGKTAPAALRDEIRSEMLKTPQHVAASAGYEMSDPKVLAPEPKLTVPVLAVYANAPWWSAEYRKAIEAFIPRLDYQTLDGAGHFLMLEKPAELNQRVVGFLRKEGLLASR